MNKKEISNKYPKVLLGYNDNQPIYLSPPSWDCDWYWGFGYLGNRDCHYHIEGLTKVKKYNNDKQVWEYKFYNLKEGIDIHFGDSYIIRPSMRWEFAELCSTTYKLKETAEVLGRGGSHLSSNPCKDAIINKGEVERINNIVIPALFEKMYRILKSNYNNDKLYKELINIDLDDTTEKVVEFMRENNIKPDDLKIIDKVSKRDFTRIHTLYCKDYHERKKNGENINW